MNIIILSDLPCVVFIKLSHHLLFKTSHQPFLTLVEIGLKNETDDNEIL